MESVTPHSIGIAILGAREAQHLTRQVVARRAGIPTATLRAVAVRAASVTLEQGCRIAQVLGLSLDALRRGLGVKKHAEEEPGGRSVVKWVVRHPGWTRAGDSR